MWKRLVLIAAAAVITACATHSQARAQGLETRGVWVATVSNIDWPSRPGLPAAEQQAELIAIFDRAAALGLNSIFLQVRPMADAIYPTRNAPWSEYLTGAAGRPPSPMYDPLAFAVTEAHKRGLKLHAWFNPFRARHASSTSPLPKSHIAMRHSGAVRRYGSQLWLDPGDAGARNEVISAIVDVVSRYDVDGVHVDDYFYPYPERNSRGNAIEFPDYKTWTRYRSSGGRLSRDDWRRDNINRFVKALYSRVKSVRPDVEVGISPFGIWRPRHPEQIRGFDAFAEIFADSRLWLRRGWVDYLAPQLYWPIERREQSFTALLDWWMEQDHLGRGVVPGLIVSRVANGRANAYAPEEIGRQIAATRVAGARGFILFSARALMEDRGGVNASISEALRVQSGAGAHTSR